MSTNKHIDRICVLAVAVALVISLLLTYAGTLGIPVQATTMGYEDRLFDTSYVHSVDIVIDDWESFLSTAQSEEYSVCNVVIDGEAFTKVGIRGKGNTSLSTVSSMGSSRYSFKIEFDHYDSSKNYHGLDKLCLNNLIQDNTMMKDYLTYRLMNEFSVAAPLCSYVYITVNGEDWGLYLAVEAVEESFLTRNYANGYGNLYKPDSMSMGGGRGNGKDFRFEDIDWDDLPEVGKDAEGTIPSMSDGRAENRMQPDTVSQGDTMSGKGAGGMGMDMGSDDAKLQYIDDDPDSYSTIFDSAKTDITASDQERLIASLKSLSSCENLEEVLDIDAVLRYFVVHNYVVNGDSYTGSMVHNYYLYEEDGQLSMIPWDYNLAFGTFQGSSSAQAVNDDMDAPLSVTGSGRPMIDWIFSDSRYLELYHDYFRTFVDTIDTDAMIDEARALISSYVETDPTKFCTYEEFEIGVDTLRTFCQLRSESISRQLDGDDTAVDASAIRLSDMGTMNNGGGNMPTASGEQGDMPQMPGGSSGEQGDAPQMPGDFSGQQGDMSQMPGGFSGQQGDTPQMPGGSSGEQGDAPQMPGGSSGEQGDTPQMPGGFSDQQGDMPQMPGGFSDQQGDMTQMPDSSEDPTDTSLAEGQFQNFPGQNRKDFSSRGEGNTPASQVDGTWVTLCIALVILAAGLLFAFKFKR